MRWAAAGVTAKDRATAANASTATCLFGLVLMIAS
jgi:hypothetical protein